MSDIALKKWDGVEIIILDREKNKCLNTKENLKKDWDLGVANIYAPSLEKLNKFGKPFTIKLNKAHVYAHRRG